MTRTIKFRGKCRKTGEWLVGDLLQVAKEVFIAPSDGDWFDFIPWSKNNVFHLPSATYQVIPDTVGQFTGLLDKNGTEIYEGDVLQRIPNEQYSDATGIPLDMLREDIGEGGDLVFVRYDESQSSVMYLSLSRKFNVHWLNTQYFTIIGNIHDNAELLKQNE